MNYAEKEAEDILFTAGRNMKDENGFYESAKNEIAQALQKKQDEIERLTARNKELEKQASPTIDGVPWYDFVSRLQKENQQLTDRVKELENYPLRVRAEKAEAQMEIYRLETIRCKEAYEPLNEKYKELESKLVGLIDQNGKVMVENHDLKSKLAAAREVLNKVKINLDWNNAYSLETRKTECYKLVHKALAELGEK